MTPPTPCPSIAAAVAELRTDSCGSFHGMLLVLGTYQVLKAHGWHTARHTTADRVRTLAIAEQRFHQVHT